MRDFRTVDARTPKQVLRDEDDECHKGMEHDAYEEYHKYDEYDEHDEYDEYDKYDEYEEYALSTL